MFTKGLKASIKGLVRKRTTIKILFYTFTKVEVKAFCRLQ